MDQPDPQCRAGPQQPGIDERGAVVDINPVRDARAPALLIFVRFGRIQLDAVRGEDVVAVEEVSSGVGDVGAVG
ncbi:hypothetical protein, partial [Pseudonocardia nigra]|uniref:hypothetical protein n=1 Tax=Pseudonocardia nigra TaxID=1921578 RepID=UPI001C5D2002